MIKLKDLLNEISIPQILYQGRKSKHKNYFDINYAGGKEVNDQEGPGIYLSSNKDDAANYAKPNGVILTIQHSLKNMIEENKSLGRFKNTAIKMINDSPNINRALEDWGDKQTLLDGMIFDDDMKETFLSIWYDLYHPNNNILYIKKMAKYGIDGIIVKRNIGFHIVVYNTNKLKIVKEEKL